jgi:AcrR family transcriptional regulator
MPTDKQPAPSVWVRGWHRAGSRKPALSRERIVRETIELVDAEGVEALSMRKLGTRLGVGATSIYWHVANKEELIELVIDEVWAEIEVPEPDDPEGWRTALARSAESMRAMILRHPWMSAMLSQSAMAGMGPNAIRLTEAIIGILREAGLPMEEADHATSALASYLLGAAGAEASYLQMLARTGQTEQELLAQMVPAMGSAVEDHVHTRELLQAYIDRAATSDPGKMRDEAFRYGLDMLLDGLEARLTRKGGRSASTRSRPRQA